MFKRIAAAWSALTTHLAKHREAKRVAKELIETQRKIDMNYTQAMQSLPKAIEGIRAMKEAYYRKGVLYSDFASLEERAEARIGGLRSVEDINAIEDTVKRYQAKVSQTNMVYSLNQYCLQMWQINAKNGSRLNKPV